MSGVCIFNIKSYISKVLTTVGLVWADMAACQWGIVAGGVVAVADMQGLTSIVAIIPIRTIKTKNC